jgi:hypothetical protein
MKKNRQLVSSLSCNSITLLTFCGNEIGYELFLFTTCASNLLMHIFSFSTRHEEQSQKI